MLCPNLLPLSSHRKTRVILLPIVLILGGGIGKWRTAQIEELVGWRRWIALILLGLIVAVLGYAASIALFFIAV
jgi:hypothetical protein